MDTFIDYSAVLDILQKYYENSSCNVLTDCLCDMCSDIQALPRITINRRGEWVYDNYNDYYPSCSCCGYMAEVEHPYCPHCGARMSAEENNEEL